MADRIDTVPMLDGPGVSELRSAAAHVADALAAAEVETGLAALDALRDLAGARRDLVSAELALVRYARAAGRTWSDVGASLGITRNAASMKYRGPLR